MFRNTLLFIFFILVQGLFAQDAQFSQSMTNIESYHPAYRDANIQQYKLTGNHRSQWKAIAAGFRTYRVAFEQNKNAFSWGVNLTNMDAGEASLKLTATQLKLNYQKALNKNGNALFAGAALGILQQSFDPTAFQFDNQYETGIGFNNEWSSNERFDFTNQISPDLSIGFVWKNKIGKFQNHIGLSWAHLNQPKASFYENETNVHPRRTSLFVQSIFPINRHINLKGELQYSQQATAKMITLRAGAQYRLPNEKMWFLDLGNRIEDAFIFSTGIRLKNIVFEMSYDWQYSKLSNATNGNGAIEIGAAYYFSRQKRNIAKKEVPVITNNQSCPKPIKDCTDCSDKDGDGIEDTIDACPNLFGEKSNRGCPTSMKDSDGDGLVDEVDECPFLKGLSIHQGCPDSDKDGVSDKIDQCPFLKGELDNFGCPKQVASTPIEGNISNPRVHVEFDTDKAHIRPIFWSQLDDLASYLKENNSTKIAISGHTDTEGNAAYNFNLGNRRSEAVRQYLLEKGISSTRISIISYGETKPIHTNNSVYGKTRNRRAEVFLVEK